MCVGESWFFGGAVTLGIWFMLLTSIAVAVWITVTLVNFWVEHFKVAEAIFDYMRNRKQYKDWKAAQSDA